MSVFLLFFVVASIHAAPLDGPYPPSLSVPHEVYGVPSIVSENTFTSSNAANTKLPVSSISSAAQQSFSGYPSFSAVQLVPGLPSHTETTSVSGVPSVSGVALIPSVQQLPSISGNPSISAFPLVPEIPHLPETIAGVSTVPGILPLPGLPAISPHPSISFAPFVSGILPRPQISQLSLVSGIESYHQAPVVAGFQYGSIIQSVPERPSTPEFPLASSVPAISSAPEFQLNIDIPSASVGSGVAGVSSIYGLPSAPGILSPSEIPKVPETSLPVVAAEGDDHDTQIDVHNESIHSGVSIQHEYGLPVEEKPVIISSAPALPELQALPDVTPVPADLVSLEYEHSTQTDDHNSGSVISHNEYGLPLEEKPLVFSPAPALPELQELPEVTQSPIASTTLKPLITSPHSVYGVPELEVSTTPVPLGHYPAQSGIISHYGEPIQVPLSLIS